MAHQSLRGRRRQGLALRLLIDTHVLLWMAQEPEKLSSSARDLLVSPANEAMVSAATIWEIAIKRKLGKLEVTVDLSASLAERGYRDLPIRARHAEAAGALPLHHGDPFDRMLIAQARAEGLTLVTNDVAFRAYDVELFVV